MKIITPESETFTPDQIEKIEERYKASYIGDFAIKTKNGWSEMPVAVFYQENPPELSPQGTGRPCSHYFGLYYHYENILDEKAPKTIMICDASSAFSVPITGVVDSKGNVFYSRYRHDMQGNKEVFIDGGRDYIRSNSFKLVHLIIEKDKLVIKSEENDVNSK